MKRVNLYLSEKEIVGLSSVSVHEKTSVSALVRRAIHQTYFENKKADFSGAVRKVAGIWTKRKDIGSTEAYVRKLRADRRSAAK